MLTCTPLPSLLRRLKTTTPTACPARLAVDQYVALATPERVVALLDLAEHMTEAVEKINGMVAAAGFSNLEAALAAFARVGRLLHGDDDDA